MTEKEKKEATIEQRLAWIQKALKAPKGQMNDYGGYKYRSLEDIFSALKPHLADYGGFVRCSDKLVMIGDRYYIEATACYHYGEQVIFSTGYAREALDRKGMDVSQITGTASSYARKYAMNGLFAIDDTRDADTLDNRDQGKKGKKGAKSAKGSKLKESKKEPPKDKGSEKMSDKHVKLVFEARKLAGRLGPEAAAIRIQINRDAETCVDMTENELTRLCSELEQRIKEVEAAERGTDEAEYPDDPDMAM